MGGRSNRLNSRIFEYQGGARYVAHDSTSRTRTLLRFHTVCAGYLRHSATPFRAQKTRHRPPGVHVMVGKNPRPRTNVQQYVRAYVRTHYCRLPCKFDFDSSRNTYYSQDVYLLFTATPGKKHKGLFGLDMNV